MKITVAKWCTPLDNIIDGVGIKPDIQVQIHKEDYAKKFDRQLDEAKKVLEKLKENRGSVSETKQFYLLQEQSKKKKELENITAS